MDKKSSGNQTDDKAQQCNFSSSSQDGESGPSRQFPNLSYWKEEIKSKRQWRYTKLGEQYSKTRNLPFNFTVMSYNILSQNLLECHKYLYKDCNPKYLGENYRMGNIIDELINSGSDIICLQEVEQHIFERILNILINDGFQGVYKKRTGDKTDGCCIFWRKMKFDFISYRAVEMKVENYHQLDRDNVGLIVCLKPVYRKSIDIKLYIATTHLLFNPRRGDIKFCQLRLLLAELDRLAFIKEENNIRHYQPIIICGDFNFTPFSPLYKFLERAFLSVDSSMMTGNLSGQFSGHGKPLKIKDLMLDEININEMTRFVPNHDSHSPLPEHNESCDNTYPFKFYHSMYLAPSRGRKYRHFDEESKPVTSVTRNGAIYIDHLFYSVLRMCSETKKSKWVADKLFLLGTLDCLTENDILEMGGLPNECLSSDHIYIMSKFLIPNK